MQKSNSKKNDSKFIVGNWLQYVVGSPLAARGGLIYNFGISINPCGRNCIYDIKHSNSSIKKTHNLLNE